MRLKLEAQKSGGLRALKALPAARAGRVDYRNIVVARSLAGGRRANRTFTSPQGGGPMKGLLILLASLYYFGGYASFDPTKAGQEARKAIAPGMTWNQVIATCKNPPPTYRTIIVQTRKGVEFTKPGPENRFDEKQLADRLARNELPHGFTFPYRFSEALAFEVVFDGAGTVQHVQDMVTMRDLLQYD